MAKIDYTITMIPPSEQSFTAIVDVPTSTINKPGMDFSKKQNSVYLSTIRGI